MGNELFDSAALTVVGLRPACDVWRLFVIAAIGDVDPNEH